MRRLSSSLIIATLLALSFLVPIWMRAQTNNQHIHNPFVPKLTLGVGYAYVSSNAPPGSADGFSNNGGFFSAAYAFKPWISLEGEFTGTHGEAIGSLGQALTLTTFTAGPRFTNRHRGYVLFAQALFGAGHASDSYFPSATGYTTSASSYAIQGGAGVDFELSDRFGLRLPAVQYLHTAYPNGVNSSENHFMLEAGVLIKFGGKYMYPTAVPMQLIKRHVSVTCSANSRTLLAGETLEVTAISKVEPDAQDVDYAWTSDAGPVSSNNATVSLDTTGLRPGRYKIVGHATLSLNNDVSAACDVPFRIAELPQPLPAPPPVIIHDAPPAADDTEFHTHVRDVLFDYDKSNLRPDSTEPMAEAVRWLKVHPGLHVLIGGYSDERGSNEYNIALGLRRAATVRDALVGAGVPSDRLQVVSYGKGAQVCVAADEVCFQRNRRAAFLIQP